MKNRQVYLDKMEKAIQEKLFFMDKINLENIDIVIDFGCANGFLIEKIKNSIAENIQIIGYDNYEYFIEICKKENKSKNITFISKYSELIKEIKDKSYAIIFSSCLHELNEKEFDKALSLMKKSSIVIIRDMFFDNSKNRKLKSNIDLSQISPKILEDFRQHYGEIDNLKNLYHLFLKYTYIENWESEVKEDYFSVDYERILSKLNNFDVIFDEPYTLPFKKEEIKNNFGYNLSEVTHRKLILKRK